MALKLGWPCKRHKLTSRDSLPKIKNPELKIFLSVITETRDRFGVMTSTTSGTTTESSGFSYISFFSKLRKNWKPNRKLSSIQRLTLLQLESTINSTHGCKFQMLRSSSTILKKSWPFWPNLVSMDSISFRKTQKRHQNFGRRWRRVVCLLTFRVSMIINFKDNSPRTPLY